MPPDVANATASTASITNTVTNLTTLLMAVGVGMLTIAILVAAYKMCFQAARLSDVAHILIGGTMAGGAAGLAAWIFGA